MNDFVFSYPTKVYFGKGAAKKALSAEITNYKKIMLAYGGGSIKKNGIYDEIMELLSDKEVIEFSGIMSNPTYKKVQEGAKLARKNNVDFILAVGGGSVIDCCKVVAAQAKNDEDIWEMIFDNKKSPMDMIKMGAVVTASGTGAEMNAGAVITNEDRKIKAGIFTAHAEFAVLDPYYTLTVPFKQVISGAFDTLSPCMETYFGTPRETYISDEINEAVNNPSDTARIEYSEKVKSESYVDMIDGMVKLIYDCCPMLHSKELQESIEVDYPYDTVRAIFDITEITDLGVKLINFFDDEDDDVEEKLKN